MIAPRRGAMSIFYVEREQTIGGKNEFGTESDPFWRVL